MYKLSVCGIAKNEQHGLREWVHYHRLVGVEHFYIYDNDSAVPVRETLAKEIASEYVTCIEFSGPSKQMPAYNHYLSNFGKDTQWAAMIDADEFMVPKKTNSVLDVLDSFINYASLQVNWVIFGSGGHLTRPQGLVIENYTQSSPSSYKENLHTKAIVQPSKIQCAGSNPHYFIPLRGFFVVGENFEGVPNAWSKTHNVETIQLNHYTIKSLEDFHAKIAKGRADAVHLPTAQLHHFESINSFCTERDNSIFRFIEPTKRLMYPDIG